MAAKPNLTIDPSHALPRTSSAIHIHDLDVVRAIA
jgi:hypothetical protein